MALAAGLLLLTGCDLDEIVSARDVDVATEESVQAPSALPAVYAGAIGDFQVAYSGFPSGSFEDGYALMSGLLADEYDSGDTFPTRNQIDQRGIALENGQVLVVYRRLHRARIAAERAIANITGVIPDDARIGELNNLAGYTYVYFGEGFCSGVPFSAQPVGGGAAVYGDPTPTADIFGLAIARFDAALGHASTPAAQRNLAQLGKARALLNLNRVDEAAALAAQVPTSFAYTLVHSSNTSRQENGFWHGLNNVKRYRVADQQGGNGLPYRSSGDPRITWFEIATAFDGTLRGYGQSKFPARDSNVRPAEGLEARLIQAEAALRGGAAGVASFVQIHNALRATVPGLAPLNLVDVAAMTQAQRVDLHFQERAFWLWQTGHRLGDLRRLVRQYARNAESVFPTGSYFKGDRYGPDVNLPIPVEEENNPNFTSCIDRNA